MKIDRFAIHHYGPLRDREFDFSAGEEGLHVVYGSNEWGKSLSLQALEHALFSLPRKPAVLGGFSEADMLQLELELVLSRRANSSMTQLAFRRRRQALSAADGAQSVDERQVQSYLGGVTADTFRQMYGLSSERIREGGRLLQSAEGDLAGTLFAAATGFERIRAVGDLLKARSNGLYSSSGNAIKPELNNAIRSLRDSFSAFSSALKSPEAIAQLRNKLAETEAELGQVETQLRGLTSRSNHLGRLQAAQSSARQLHAARQQLAALGEPQLLAETFRRRLDAARTDLMRVATLRQEARTRLMDLGNRRNGIAIDSQIVGAADAINKLLASSGELHTLNTDLPRRHEEIDRLIRANSDLLQGIAAMTGEHVRETASQSPETLTQIESLIQAHGGIVTACEEREGQLKEGRHSLASLEFDLGMLEADGDIQPLRNRLGVIRDAGDLEKLLADRRNELTVAVMEYAATAQRLDGLQTTTPVEDLHVPPLEEVRDYREQFRAVERRRDEIDAATRDATKEITSLESDIARLEETADLPDEGSLDRVRRDRDSFIEATASAMDGGGLPAADATKRFGEISRLVKDADDLADRLRIHATQASQRANHRIRIEELRKRIHQCDADSKNLSARVLSIDQSWAALWQTADVLPKSPVAMEQWLAIRNECLTQAGGLRKLQREIDSLEQVIEAHRTDLLAILRDLGISPTPDASRRQLLDQTATALEERQAQAIKRDELINQIKNAERTLPRLEALLQESLKKRDAWNQQWAECMAVLNQPADTSQATGRFLLGTMRKVAANEAEINSVRDRIAKMERRQAEIHEVMQRVCVALDTPFDPDGAQHLSRSASERLLTNQAAFEQQNSLDEQISDIEAELEGLRRDEVAAKAILTTLRAESLVNDDGDLDAAWERSERFREFQQAADRCEQEFLQQAGDANSQQLIDECVARMAEEIDQELGDIQRQCQELRDRRDVVRDQQKVLQTQIDALGGDQAARAATDCRMHEAEVLARVREYIPLRLASLALTRASRRYRDEHHAPVLTRASNLFQRITGGRYSAIRLADNDLYAVRSDTTTESVLQRYMSEGTRDQIYLALRLASLEHAHEQGAEPLPLILDDGLVQFDDSRTAAMLEVLAEISSGMQVILFTHHRSVLEAAESLQASVPHSVFLHGEAIKA